MHCPYDKLGDLEACFDDIRSWPETRESKPGVFYIKRLAFLHFHIDKQERRWADIREGALWGSEHDIPIDAGSAAKRAFLKEARRRYEATLATLPSRRAPKARSTAP